MKRDVRFTMSIILYDFLQRILKRQA